MPVDERRGRQARDIGVDQQFLAQLADQRRLRRFARLDLAAGELPQAAHILFGRALLHENRATDRP